MRRLIVAITGASGAAYGVQLLRRLRERHDVEIHLLLSAAGVLNTYQELDLKRGDVESLAHVVHSVNDIGATVASGSFATDGMVIAPCSMKTLAAIAHGAADNLITRAADVCLKERRRLVLLAREAPLNLAHIRNMDTGSPGRPQAGKSGSDQTVPAANSQGGCRCRLRPDIPACATGIRYARIQASGTASAPTSGPRPRCQPS